MLSYDERPLVVPDVEQDVRRISDDGQSVEKPHNPLRDRVQSRAPPFLNRNNIILVGCNYDVVGFLSIANDLVSILFVVRSHSWLPCSDTE